MIQEHRFVFADLLWNFCMAVNLYLAVFHRFSALDLRKMEWKYCLFCYGTPFVPALVLLFVKSETRGRVYGDAIVRQILSNVFTIPQTSRSYSTYLPNLALVLDYV